MQEYMKKLFKNILILNLSLNPKYWRSIMDMTCREAIRKQERKISTRV